MSAQLVTPGSLARTIAFVHHKGGTGKTTACINVAGWLNKMKKRVLVIDLDPQGNATAGLGIDRSSIEDTIYDVMFGFKNLGMIILETESGVYLAPSSLDLLAAETHMAGQSDNTAILKGSLKDVDKFFDYILIDVPPGSTLLMINGIVASENIIIPVDSGVFAFETLETLKTLIIDLAGELGVEVNVMMLLLKQHPGPGFWSNPTKEIKGMLKRFLSENNISEVDIYKIPFSTKIYKAQMKGSPISHFAPRSDVGKAYKRITKGILNSV
ncbi:MAG: AAA family ATPase [Pseudomonadota bacterium]